MNVSLRPSARRGGRLARGLTAAICLLLFGFCGLLAYRSFCTGQGAAGGAFCLLAVLCPVFGRMILRSSPGKKQGLRRGAAVGLVLIALLATLPMGVYIFIYESNFGQRFETCRLTAHSLEDFPGLTAEACAFPSDRGQLLAGYRYQKGEEAPQGVIVLAHGFGGGGHISYLSIINELASGGYIVFAYDATGNDASEGRAVGGLPQGVIDLDYVLRYVKADPQMGRLPIGLWGHSWGGHSVCAVLERHPDVKGAVAFSGFDRSMDMIEAQGRKIAGAAIRLLLPYGALYEWLKFGGYADSSAMSGFAASEARAMILHSENDTVVPMEYGYDRYFAGYGADSRFVFRKFADLGHNGIFLSQESREYARRLDEELSACLEGLEGDARRQAEDAWLEVNLDKSRWQQPDRELFDEILAFYRQALTR